VSGVRTSGKRDLQECGRAPGGSMGRDAWIPVAILGLVAGIALAQVWPALWAGLPGLVTGLAVGFSVGLLVPAVVLAPLWVPVVALAVLLLCVRSWEGKRRQ
jgi:uncharacterized membrane protein